MGFNISGIAIAENLQNNIKAIEQEIGFKLELVDDTNFENASSNWKDDGICDIYFGQNGTLIFMSHELCMVPYSLLELPTFTFAISDTAMTFSFYYCEDGTLKRSLSVAEGDKLNDEGQQLEIELDSIDIPEIIWFLLDKTIGEHYMSIDLEKKAYRFKLIKNNNISSCGNICDVFNEKTGFEKTNKKLLELKVTYNHLKCTIENITQYFVAIFESLLLKNLDVINSTAKNDNDWKKQKISGKVKYLKTKSYKAVVFLDRIEKGRLFDDYEQDVSMLFDIKGNLVEKCNYDFGCRTSKYTYQYSKKGYRIKKQKYCSVGCFNGMVLYKYNKKGDLVEERRCGADCLTFNILIYKYNEKGNNVSIREDQDEFDNNILKYDDKNNLIEDIMYYDKATILWRHSFKYDENGQQIKEVSYNLEGDISCIWTYKYDAIGNIVEKETRSSMPDLLEKINYVYDFDSFGNWIRRLKFTDNRPVTIVEREIEYFAER